MKYVTTLALITGCLLTAPAAWSEEEPAVEEGPWSGKLGLGYTAVSGNADTSSFSFDAEVNYDAEKWHHKAVGRAIMQSADNSSTAEAYKALWESKYNFSGRTYAYGQVDYNKNRFSSFERQIFAVVGLGRAFIDKEKHKLNAQAGVGATDQKLIDGTDADGFVGRLDGDYTWDFSENASFVQKLSVSISSDNTFTQSLTELRAGLIGALNMVLSYAIQNNSDVVPGTDKTDTFTTVSLEYAF